MFINQETSKKTLSYQGLKDIVPQSDKIESFIIGLLVLADRLLNLTVISVINDLIYKIKIDEQQPVQFHYKYSLLSLCLSSIRFGLNRYRQQSQLRAKHQILAKYTRARGIKECKKCND